jgi:hypothetical protein
LDVGVEEAAYFIKLLSQLIVGSIFKVTSKDQVILDFGQRPLRNIEEPRLIHSASAPESFGDVGGIEVAARRSCELSP